jgi:hypothetical protein
MGNRPRIFIQGTAPEVRLPRCCHVQRRVSFFHVDAPLGGMQCCLL